MIENSSLCTIYKWSVSTGFEMVEKLLSGEIEET
jgi:hypothetical protein